MFIYSASASNIFALNTGNFGVSIVDYEPPANDRCTDAIPVLVNGAIVTGTTVNATQEAFCFTFGADPVGRGAWLLTIGTGNMMTVSTCPSATTFNSRLAVQNGGCGAGCVVAQDAGLTIAPCLNPFGRQLTFG
jgi:hypothetical protein